MYSVAELQPQPKGQFNGKGNHAYAGVSVDCDKIVTDVQIAGIRDSNRSPTFTSVILLPDRPMPLVTMSTQQLFVWDWSSPSLVNCGPHSVDLSAQLVPLGFLWYKDSWMLYLSAFRSEDDRRSAGTRWPSITVCCSRPLCSGFFKLRSEIFKDRPS